MSADLLDALVADAIRDLIAAALILGKLYSFSGEEMSPEMTAMVDKELSICAANISVLNSMGAINTEAALKIVQEKFTSLLNSAKARVN